MNDEVKAVEQQDDLSIDTNIDDLDGGDLLSGGEGSGEVEIVLAGQDGSPSSEAKPDHRDHILRRLQKKRDRIEQENLELKLKLAAQNSSAVESDNPPVLEDFEYDDAKHQAALSRWQVSQTERVTKRVLQQQQDGHNVVAASQKKEKALETYAETASKLGVLDFNETQDKAMDVLGEDFSEVLATNLPTESPKLMYWFGKNPQKAAEYRDRYLSNPGATTFELGKLAAQLTVKRKRSSAADPEKHIESSGVTGGTSDFLKGYKNIMKQLDSGKLEPGQGVRQVRALKREAKVAGYDVSQLKE
jgi:hypothetical protein